MYFHTYTLVSLRIFVYLYVYAPIDTHVYNSVHVRFFCVFLKKKFHRWFPKFACCDLLMVVQQPSVWQLSGQHAHTSLPAAHSCGTSSLSRLRSSRRCGMGWTLWLRSMLPARRRASQGCWSWVRWRADLILYGVGLSLSLNRGILTSIYILWCIWNVYA